MQAMHQPMVTLLPRDCEKKHAPRAYAVGMTGSGKSTMLEVLMQQYQNHYSSKELPVRVLIVDTKPRFRAQWEIAGIPTHLSRRYSKWGHNAPYVPGAYAVPHRLDPKWALDHIWKQGATVAIASAERKSDWSWINDVTTAFYEGYGTKYPRLVFIDELADFFQFGSMSDIITRLARNGRERDVAVLAGSQRPRKVPKEIMTEFLRLYLFRLDYQEDIKHIKEFGIPPDIKMPNGHDYYMYDRTLGLRKPSDEYYRLAL